MICQNILLDFICLYFLYHQQINKYINNYLDLSYQQTEFDNLIILINKSMISKNIKKSSQILQIAPNYLKFKTNKQQNIKKNNNAITPKSSQIDSIDNVSLKQKTKMIRTNSKNIPKKFVDQVKSISPYLKNNEQLVFSKQKRVNSNNKTKNKNRKQQIVKSKHSFNGCKSDIFNNIKKNRDHIKSYKNKIHQSLCGQDLDWSNYKKNESKNKEINIDDRNLVDILKHTDQLLNKYKSKLRQMNERKKSLQRENINLKNRLNQYQLF